MHSWKARHSSVPRHSVSYGSIVPRQSLGVLFYCATTLRVVFGSPRMGRSAMEWRCTLYLPRSYDTHFVAIVTKLPDLDATESPTADSI